MELQAGQRDLLSSPAEEPQQSPAPIEEGEIVTQAQAGHSQWILGMSGKSLGNIRAGEHCFLHIFLSIVVVLVTSKAECVDVRKGFFFHPLPL